MNIRPTRSSETVTVYSLLEKTQNFKYKVISEVIQLNKLPTTKICNTGNRNQPVSAFKRWDLLRISELLVVYTCNITRDYNAMTVL